MRVLNGRSSRGHADLVQFLLKRGSLARLSNLQYEILWIASRYGYDRLVRMMPIEGLDMNATQLEGERALRFAAVGGHESIVSLLLERGADQDYEDNDFDAMNGAAENGHEHVVQLLLDNGVDIYTFGSRGDTPLFEAAKA